MDLYTPGHTRLAGAGAYLPDSSITSAFLMQQIESARRFGLEEQWLAQATGVRERLVAPAGLQATDMAAQAALRALAGAMVDPGDVDLVIYAGSDRTGIPHGASQLVADRLGARRAVTVDVINPLHGFIAGLHLTDTLVARERLSAGLVVTGQSSARARRAAMEELRQRGDRALLTHLLPVLNASDAGGAVLVTRKRHALHGFAGFLMAAGLRPEAPEPVFAAGSAGQGTAGCNAAETGGARHSFARFLREIGWAGNDVAHFAGQQDDLATARRISACTGIPSNRMVHTASRYGDLGSSTVPVALYLLGQQRRIGAGSKVVIAGGGTTGLASHVGLVWG